MTTNERMRPGAGVRESHRVFGGTSNGLDRTVPGPLETNADTSRTLSRDLSAPTARGARSRLARAIGTDSMGSSEFRCLISPNAAANASCGSLLAGDT
jgi:hypothetical protein